MLTDILLTAALIHLSVLLSVAGLSKSLAPSAFSETLNSHGLIPRRRSQLVARSVITAELVLGVWLISGFAYRFAAAATAALLVMFLLYRAALRAFGPEGASCGCLGDSSAADTVGVMMNLVVALAVTVSASGSSRYAPELSVLLSAVWIGAALALAARSRRVNPAAAWHVGNS
jgi:uncharacterized membrane protein YphA (DoxX/SURF4 family)